MLNVIFNSRMSHCFKLVQYLMLNSSSLNPDKSEAIIVSTSARQQSEGSLDVIDLGEVHVQP